MPDFPNAKGYVEATKAHSGSVKLGGKNGRAGQLAASSKSPGEIVTELYLATLGRPPSDDELKAAVAPFRPSGFCDIIAGPGPSASPARSIRR